MAAGALTVAVRLLARREHTADELRRKLKQRGFADSDVESALMRLRENDLQSDRRFSDDYLRQMQWRWGDFRLRAELQKRGVREEECNAAFAAAKLPPEAERAAAVLKKKYPRGVVEADENTARRFLHSRGFGSDSIRAALAGIGKI